MIDLKENKIIPWLLQKVSNEHHVVGTDFLSEDEGSIEEVLTLVTIGSEQSDEEGLICWRLI